MRQVKFHRELKFQARFEESVKTRHIEIRSEIDRINFTLSNTQIAPLIPARSQSLSNRSVRTMMYDDLRYHRV